MADLMPMVHAERRSLADFLDTLSPEQWTAPTWCDKWNVQELVGHLTAAGNITAPHFFAGFVQCGIQLRQVRRGRPAAVREGHPGRRSCSVRGDRRQQPQAARTGVRRARRGDVSQRGHPAALGANGEHPAEHLTTLAELYTEDRRAAACEEAARRPEHASDRRRLVDRLGSGGQRSVHVADPRHGRPCWCARRLRG